LKILLLKNKQLEEEVNKLKQKLQKYKVPLSIKTYYENRNTPITCIAYHPSKRRES
jgi:hypothetical protein